MLDRLKKYFGFGDLGSKVPKGPIVSIIVIVYDMPEQAKNTLISLMSDYQMGVSLEEYEVIVVENRSSNLMSQAFVDTLPENFSYYLREEKQPTPIFAVEFGATKARGDNICLMIDGARLLSPGVVKNIVLGHRIHENAVVTVPGYHLGSELQQEAVNSGYGVEAERELITSIDWPVNGYRLFDISCFSGSCARGYFLPNSESNCISISRVLWAELGGCDLRFDMRGGGLVNLDFYKRTCEYSGVTHVVLHGEGTFHQYHGGVTTGGEAREARDSFIKAIKEQYREIRGHEYSSPQSNPVYLGQFSPESQRFLYFSSGTFLESRGKKPV